MLIINEPLNNLTDTSIDEAKYGINRKNIVEVTTHTLYVAIGITIACFCIDWFWLNTKFRNVLTTLGTLEPLFLHSSYVIIQLANKAIITYKQRKEKRNRIKCFKSYAGDKLKIN